MKMWRQIGSVTAMNLRSIPQRLSTSLVIVIGIAGVVAVLVSVLAMSTGMIKTMNNTGRDDRALVLRNGSAAESGSVLSRDAVRLISDGAGIRRDVDGKPIVSAEGIRLVNMFKKGDGAEINVVLRGVGNKFQVLRPEFRILEGRMFNAAVNEIVVGKSAHAQFKGLAIGDRITTRGANWTVVGIFSSGGDSHESELLADIDTLNSAERRGGGAQSVNVQLQSTAAFQAFKDSLTSNPALAVDVYRERDYYRQQSRTIGRVISVIAYVVGGIMAIGAIFGALNTMYSAVSARLQEIATLRALGFGSTAMVISVLSEALLLSCIGGAIGAVLAWLFFNGHVVSTGGTATGQLVFELTVSPQLVVTGIVWACVIGLIGGLFPAVRAARLPVATALRAI
ncbi:ABC transporter permease [Povalibacter sp.]|uniref:ABC transporter permease n=1 Tax=Povalibacter sp. TaxID=1962978 RepID=UPI002F428B2A